MSDSPNEQRKAFRILDIPAEIRELIYEYALQDSGHTYNAGGLNTVWIDRRDHDGYTEFRFPPILHINRQLRVEAAAVWFKKFRFLFEEVWTCAAWMRALNKKFRNKLKTLIYCKTYSARRIHSPPLDRKTLLRIFREQYGLEIHNQLQIKRR